MAKSSKNAINIAFFDVSQMSGSMQAVYLAAIYAGLAAAFYWFYRLLVVTPEEAEAAKQAKREAKLAKKAKKH